MKKYTFPLLFIVILTGCAESKTRLTVLFDRVDGLTVGSDVQNKGIKIGEVIKLELFEKLVLANLELNPEIRIPVDSKFTVVHGILTVTSIDVEFSDKTNYLTIKDTLRGKYLPKTLIDDLISDTAKKRQIENSLQKITKGVEEIVETVRKDSSTKR